MYRGICPPLGWPVWDLKPEMRLTVTSSFSIKLAQTLDVNWGPLLLIWNQKTSEYMIKEQFCCGKGWRQTWESYEVQRLEESVTTKWLFETRGVGVWVVVRAFQQGVFWVPWFGHKYCIRWWPVVSPWSCLATNTFLSVSDRFCGFLGGQ